MTDVSKIFPELMTNDPLRGEIIPAEDGPPDQKGGHLTAYAGPLPPVDEVKGWEEISPGTADRFLTLFEQQTQHEITTEQQQLALAQEIGKREYDLRRQGQWMGFVIAVLGLVITASLILMDHPVAGSILGGTSLLCLVGAFLYGRATDTPKAEAADED